MPLFNIILAPFSWLITTFCHLFANNYGLALILFAVVVKVILFPFSLKGKRSMVKMSAIQGKAQRIQKQYANNKQKQQEELQKLYAKENVNPMSGCLWSFLPLLFLIPLYSIIRQPLSYMMSMGDQAVQAVAQVLHFDLAANPAYGQLNLAALVTPENLETVRAGLVGAAQSLFAGEADLQNILTTVGQQAQNLFSIDFGFLGLDLSVKPELQFWTDWANVGVHLLPWVSAALSLLMSLVSQKTNRMANPNAQQQGGGFMMYVFSPLMSLWIGFMMPAGLCIYWIVNSLLSMVQEFLCAKLLKKDYEEAAEQARKQAILDKEEEKRRRAALSAERARRAEERKQKGKKKDKDKTAGVDVTASRVGIRAYARGRAYDPDRFGGVTEYRDPNAQVDEDAIEKARAAKDEKRAEAQLEADVTAQVAAEMEQFQGKSAEELEQSIGQLDQEREQEALADAEAEAEALAAAIDDPGTEEETEEDK